MRIDQNVASLVAVAEGSVSIYLSTGGGFIGGGQHPTVRAAGRRLLERAEAALASLTPAASFEPPPPGHIGFIVLTYEGKLGANVAETELVAGAHPLSSVSETAQDVITEFRIASGG